MDLSQFFTEFQSQESIAILVFLIIAFLLGLLAGRLSLRTKITRLQRDVESLQKERTELQAETAGLREQLDLKDADLRKASFDLQEREDKLNRLEIEKAQFNNQLTELNNEIQQLKASNQTYSATIEDLNDQIIGLKTQNQQLSTQLTIDDDATNDLAEVQSTYNATRQRLENLENKLERLASENRELQSTIREIKEAAGAVPRAPIATPAAGSPAEPELERKLTQDKKVLGEKIILEEHPQDDLTRIEGLGPFIAKKLNEAGVHTFADISRWNEERIREITEKIGYIPGRIRQDDWVGQARRLQEKQQENPEAFRQKTLAPTNREDLKIIEGIGPKIEEILRDAGIRSWDDLAESEVDHLRDILATAGAQYRVHDPATWPAQARLAINGDWELLKEYQDQLIGGREAE